MQNQLYGAPKNSNIAALFEDAAVKSEAGWWEFYKSVNGGY